ncbi:MAG TPA: serine hydrolase [Allosphingosinicella sp.]
MRLAKINVLAKLGLIGPAALIGASVPATQLRAAPSPAAAAMLSAAQPRYPAPRPLLQPARPQPGVNSGGSRSAGAVVTPAERAAQRALEERLASLGRAFQGEVGIAVRDVETDWAASWNGSRLFPQQSVSKFWVALTAFNAIDNGRLELDRRVTLRRQDLTLFNQPIAAQVGANGFTTTIDDLMHRAITRSDNTANDFVLWQAGGPEAVRAFISRHGIEGVRFGPGERLLQSRIAGISWNQSYSQRGGFEAARAAVPAASRRRNFENYVADPIDGASPLGLTQGLAMLQRGELLSQQSTRRMLSIMAQTRTGPQRLTGGLAPGWRIAHKTGTGQVLGGTQAGYNDIGIITSPDGRHYALSVTIGRTSVPNIVRMQLMQNVTRAAIAYHEARRGYGGGY